MDWGHRESASSWIGTVVDREAVRVLEMPRAGSRRGTSHSLQIFWEFFLEIRRLARKSRDRLVGYRPDDQNTRPQNGLFHAFNGG